MPATASTPVKAAPRPALSIPTPVAAPTPAAKPVAAIATAPVASAPGNLTELWSRLIDAIGRVSPFTRGYLIDAHPVSFEKNVLIIGFDPEFADHLGLVDNARNHTLLATKLAELGHANAMIKFIKAETPANWNRNAVAATPAPKPISTPTATPSPVTAKPVEKAVAPIAAEKKAAPVAFNKEDFKNDPLIKKALEIFKGTIVEVRA